jgi:hypothetical protein
MSNSILDMKYRALNPEQLLNLEVALLQVRKISGIDVHITAEQGEIWVCFKGMAGEMFDIIDEHCGEYEDELVVIGIRDFTIKDKDEDTRTVRQMIEVFKNIKFANNGEVVGKDESRRKEILELKEYLVQELRDCADLDVAECCVCHETTLREIACKHRVCLRCITKIKSCPMCRGDLILHRVAPVFM